MIRHQHQHWSSPLLRHYRFVPGMTCGQLSGLRYCDCFDLPCSAVVACALYCCWLISQEISKVQSIAEKSLSLFSSIQKNLIRIALKKEVMKKINWLFFLVISEKPFACTHKSNLNALLIYGWRET